MDFVIKDYLTEQEHETLFRWSPDPFGTKGLNMTWRPVERHLVVLEDGRPVSHVGMVRSEISVGGKRFNVGGCGKVITVPEFQGRGIARAAMGEAVRVIANEWHPDHCLLFCRPARQTFYEMLGWLELREPVWALQPAGFMLSVCSMTFTLNGCNWPTGPIDLEGLPW